MTRTLQAFLLPLPALMLSSCAAVGPDYQSPTPELPTAFGSTESPQRPETSPDRWWSTFDDPLLTQLIEDAVRQNQDIRVAVAAVREVRAAQRITGARSLPSLDASGSYSRQRTSENGVIDLGTLSDAGLADVETDLYGVGLEASWEVDVFGSVRRDQFKF